MWQENFLFLLSDSYQYITTYTNDNYRRISVAFMQRKSQLPQAFTAFRRELQVLAKRKLELGEIHTSNNDDFKIEDTGIRIVRVHSDGGKEYEKLERLYQQVSGLLRLSTSFMCGIACAMHPQELPRTIW
jgi:hypothetical protein